MPILKAETELYPADLARRSGTCRHRAKVVGRVHQIPAGKGDCPPTQGDGCALLLPLVPQTSMIGTRWVKSLLPLFPSYLFVFGTDLERVATLVDTAGDPNVMCRRQRGHDAGPGKHPDDDCGRSAHDAGVSLGTRPPRADQEGALMGMEGTVVTRRGGRTSAGRRAVPAARRLDRDQRLSVGAALSRFFDTLRICGF